ncbi:MAG: hypothetical protein EZS28_011816, partial [Streblomastix strix]
MQKVWLQTRTQQFSSNQPRTIWEVSDQAASQHTIEQTIGKLTLQYIDFGYVMTTESTPVSTPTSSIISIHSLQDPYPDITIEHCNFEGKTYRTYSMLRIEGGQRVIVDKCSFSSMDTINSPIQATSYKQFSVSNSNFTDINCIGTTGAIDVSQGRGNDWSISIASNYFDNCIGESIGAFSI